MIVMVMAASGVMTSWMNGFRRAYDIQVNTWNFWEERGIALLLVIFGLAPMVFALGLVAFGDLIERWLLMQVDRDIGLYVLLLWKLGRWLISALTSITVKPRASSNSYRGIQYSPVDSIATVSTPQASSQSAR